MRATAHGGPYLKADKTNERARVEGQFGRWKQVIGDGLRFHSDEARATEVAVAAQVLNRMLDLGRPDAVRVAWSAAGGGGSFASSSSVQHAAVNLKYGLRQIETDERRRHRTLSGMKGTYPSYGTKRAPIRGTVHLIKRTLPTEMALLSEPARLNLEADYASQPTSKSCMSRSDIKIVLSYRRADAQGTAGRLFDRLEQHFGKKSVFMDVDTIPFGVDFREHIQEQLKECDALLAVIGPRWLGPGRGKGPRIKDETDWVRIEVETALQRKIPVIPVLVDGAALPRQDQLPESLQPLVFRQAAPVDSGRDFHAHVDRLIRSLDRLRTDDEAASIVPKFRHAATEENSRSEGADEGISREAGTPPSLPEFATGDSNTKTSAESKSDEADFSKKPQLRDEQGIQLGVNSYVPINTIEDKDPSSDFGTPDQVEKLAPTAPPSPEVISDSRPENENINRPEENFLLEKIRKVKPAMWAMLLPGLVIATFAVYKAAPLEEKLLDPIFELSDFLFRPQQPSTDEKKSGLESSNDLNVGFVLVDFPMKANDEGGAVYSVGQTFTVPNGTSKLENFDIYLKSSSIVKFKAYISAWNGNRPVAPILFESEILTISPSDEFTRYRFYPKIQVFNGTTYIAYYAHVDEPYNRIVEAVSGPRQGGNAFFISRPNQEIWTDGRQAIAFSAQFM